MAHVRLLAVRCGSTTGEIGCLRCSLNITPGMTEKQLEEIVGKAHKTYEILDGLLLHRIGNVRPGEDIVLIAIWANHRKDAFSACREIMEALKSKAPFWKKEPLAKGDRWLENNTPGE